MSTATVVCDPGRLGSLEDGWRRLAERAEDVSVEEAPPQDTGKDFPSA